MPSLRSVRLLNFPDEDNVYVDDVDDGIYFEGWVLRDLQQMADKMFAKVPKLKAMGLGRGENKTWFSVDGEPFVPPYYMRGRTFDVRGVERAVGIEVTKDEVAELEATCDIFDLEIRPGRFLRYGYKP